jgi:hypothetical protein
VISVAVIIAVGHLRYHEVDELRAGVRRTVGDRRLRVANNIRVRRSALALSKVSDLHEMFEATRHLLDFGEFSFANAQVGQPGRADMNERAYYASLQRHPKQSLEFRNGRVFWCWNGKDEEDLPSRSDWCIRLPLVKDGVDWGWLNFYRSADSEPLLVDTNYLADLFRREFTDATARILALHEEPVAASAMAMTAESAR